MSYQYHIMSNHKRVATPLKFTASYHAACKRESHEILNSLAARFLANRLNVREPTLDKCDLDLGQMPQSEDLRRESGCNPGRNVWLCS